MLKGHLPGVIYHQVYYYTKKKWPKTRPESRLDWLIVSRFARKREASVGDRGAERKEVLEERRRIPLPGHVRHRVLD